MSARSRLIRCCLLLSLPLTLTCTALASPGSAMQAPQTPAAASRSTVVGGPMAGMSMPAPATTSPTPDLHGGASHVPRRARPPSRSGAPHARAMPVPATPEVVPATDRGDRPGVDHGAMPGMDHGAMPGMDDGARPGAGHGGMRAMTMRPMRSGEPPAGFRDPDYSAGTGDGSIHGLDMAMDDDARIGMLLVDQLEAFHGRHGNGQQWDIQGHYGNDYDKLWLRSEGERSGGRLADASVEALWNHAVAPFWSTQLGVRADAGEGPRRTWAAFGIQGLAPYWFELEATGYVGASGRTAARFRAEYELLFTQRLVLQPELELNAYGRDDPPRRLGSGLADASLGLRLRYEFHRQFAPYVGVMWTRRFGRTARFAREEGQGPFDRQWVAGVRVWF